MAVVHSKPSICPLVVIRSRTEFQGEATFSQRCVFVETDYRAESRLQKPRSPLMCDAKGCYFAAVRCFSEQHLQSPLGNANASNEMSSERPRVSNPTPLAAPPLTHGGGERRRSLKEEKKEKKILRSPANVPHVSARTED